MFKVQTTYIKINAASSYTLVRSSASFSGLTAAEVILDYDTKNRYFRDESFGISDVPALTAGKNFADNVGTFTDAIETVGVGKGVIDTLGMGDFAYVLLTLQRVFTDTYSVGDTSSLTAGINRTETLIANEVLSYDLSKLNTDSATLGDSPATLLSLAKTETLPLSDAFTRVITFSRAFTDTITLDDFTDVNAFTKDTIGAKSNAISFIDTQHFSTQKGLIDAPVLTDVYASSFITTRTDSVSVAESITILNRSLAPSLINTGAFNTATLNNQEILMLKDSLKMTGHLAIAINGEVVQEVPNLVVASGKGYVASRMKDTSLGAMSHMAIGTNTGAAAAGNTALGAENDRNSLTSTTVSAGTVTYVATFGAGEGTGAVTEAGLFNASSGGTLLCRTVFAVVNKGSQDSMTITWSVTVS